jgi:transcriptional regulator with XRE-family HTH domain
MCECSGMTNLASFLLRSGRSRGDVANALGISRSYFSELESGVKTPGLALAVEIERLTEGAVPVASWLEPSSGRTAE